MRHRIKTKKLSRNKSHRKALLRNLMNALILRNSITTTSAKAKETKRFAERLLSIAKKNDINSHKKVFQALGNKKVVKKFFGEIVPQFGDRVSGDVRIVKMGKRKGDGADMSLIEFILPEKKRGKEEKPKRRRPRIRRKATPKKEEKQVRGKKKVKEKPDEGEKEKVAGKKVTKKGEDKGKTKKRTRKK